MEMYALIMAGGEGKRFWPLSSRERPKQFLSLIGGKSLLRQTVDRLLPLIPIGNIFIVTVDRYAEETLKHVPELPLVNMVLESEGKNTAPCIAYGTLRIHAKAEDPVIAVVPADHAIGDDEAFRDTIRFAAEAAAVKNDNGQYPLITLGVRPSSPETGYGYIKQTDHVVFSSDNHRALKVERFTEKPDLKTALRFLDEGGYYWNSGVFIWKCSSIISEFSRILPDWHSQFDRILETMDKISGSDVIVSFYKSIEPGSIDKLILEKSENTVVIPVNFPWSDVGSWKALDEFLRNDGEDNIIYGKGVSIDSSGCLIYGDRKVVALVGVKDLVVVDSGNGVLVLNKENSQDVKKVIDELNKKGKL